MRAAEFSSTVDQVWGFDSPRFDPVEKARGGAGRLGIGTSRSARRVVPLWKDLARAREGKALATAYGPRLRSQWMPVYQPGGVFERHEPTFLVAEPWQCA